jgi:Tol biopolymer transport system component
MMNVSRDGQSLVFVSSRGGRQEVWVRDLRSGRERQLTHWGASHARISPDGSRVAVHTWTSKLEAHLVASGGGPARPFCTDCRFYDWSPDGSRAVIGRGNPMRLLVLDVASGQERELAAHARWNLFQARYSPDGRWIAFHTTNSPGLRQIYVVPASADGPVAFERWVLAVADFGLQPSWSSDGKAIYHFSQRDGVFCPWVQAVDPVSMRPAGPPRAVTHLHDPRLRAAAGEMVSNDVEAGALYATLTHTAGSIWMLER